MGYALTFAGDVDGDGLDDLLLGARYLDAAGSNAGGAYLVEGPVSGLASLSSATARLLGVASSDQAGSAVGGAGDVDGDGLADLLVGAPEASVGASGDGCVYLIAGGASGDVSLADASTRLIGDRSGDAAGSWLGGPADLDGDGLDDLIVGAEGSAVAYLVLAPAAGDVALGDAYATLSAVGLGASTSGATVGDVDVDGSLDIVVGYELDSAGGTYAGAVRLLLGPFEGVVDVASPDALLLGEVSGGKAGHAVAGGGDLNADGYSDFAIGAFNESSGGSLAGAAYLILGGGY